MFSRFSNAAAAILLAVATTMATGSPALAYPQPRPEEWWLGNEGYQVESALWPYSTGAGVVVGLIDTGVNANLPELSSVTLPGTNFKGGDDRTDTDDAAGGHGTAMAALIAGQGGGVGNMVGIAPGAKILPVQEGFNWPVAVRWAVDHGAKVVNMSFSTAAEDANFHYGCDADEMSAISYALQKDVVLVAEAGDYGNSVQFARTPAMCPGILAVGGIDKHGSEWPESSPGYYIAVGAPAVDVGSIGRNGTFGVSTSGTSQAAALVSAMVALIRSKFPRMSGREVVRQLIDSAQSLAQEGEWDPWAGYGGVRPRLVLQESNTILDSGPNPVYERFDQWRESGSATAPVLGAASSGPMPSVSPTGGSGAQPSGVASARQRPVAEAGKKSGETLLVIGIAAAMVLAAGGLSGLLVFRCRDRGATSRGIVRF